MRSSTALVLLGGDPFAALVYRARRREGLRLVQVQLRETEVDALIESGWLEEHSRNNSNAVIDALHRLFDRVSSRMTRNAPRTW